MKIDLSKAGENYESMVRLTCIQFHTLYQTLSRRFSVDNEVCKVVHCADELKEAVATNDQTVNFYGEKLLNAVMGMYVAVNSSHTPDQWSPDDYVVNALFYTMAFRANACCTTDPMKQIYYLGQADSWALRLADILEGADYAGESEQSD